MSFKYSNFGQGLKAARKKRGIKTQEDFVSKLGEFGFATTLATVRNWEQGKAYPEAQTLETLCDFFKCDMDYLFGCISCKTHDTQFICDYTGLDEETVEKLHSRKDTHKGASVLLNYLLKDGGILNDLGEYYSSIFWDKENVLKYGRLFQYIHTPPRKSGQLLGNILNDLPLDREEFYNSCRKDQKLKTLMGCTYIENELPDRIIDSMPVRLYKKLNNIAVHGTVEMDEDDKAMLDFLTVIGYSEFLGRALNLEELEKRIDSDIAKAEQEWQAADDYAQNDDDLF